LAGQQQQIVIYSRETEKIVLPESEIKANLFRKMIDLAKPHTIPRYSQNLHYAAIVILFRSHSTYEFLRTFLPLPSPRAVYSHFGSALAASRGRLQSLDAMIAYLSVQIALSPELTAGCVFAIDAIFCSNTFIGMRRIDMSDTAYLFMLYLQPINPNIKCCQLFVIESPSGIGNERIRVQIDEILELIQSLIPRRFIASDGDSSYYQRHKTFMDFWEPIYQGFGLDRTLAELKQHPHVMPLSDLLHLGQNFRTWFLKYELTFVYGGASSSISQERVRVILDLAAPLPDLSQIGKMRHAYPLVITRIENTLELIDQNAFPEAVALLPLSLCFHAMRLETITRETRIDLLRTAFLLV
jgi:hypothetical protein